MIVPENQLFLLDPQGCCFRGKVPAYVTTQVLARYGPDIARSRLRFWFLTQQTITVKELHTWIGDRDFFESIYLLPPGSHLWVDAQSHSLDYVQASPMPDPERNNEMWMIKRITIQDSAQAIWITRYLIEEKLASHPTDTSFQPLQWYKDLARRRYQEQMGEQDHKQLIYQIAKGLTPGFDDVTDCLELLVNEPELMTTPLLAHVQMTIVDLIRLHIYRSLVTFLEEECTQP